MRVGSTLILLAWLLVSAGLVVHADAATIPACVAEDIIAEDPGCPSSGLCTITRIFSIDDDCVLDFGTRDVTITASGELRIAGATVTLKTGNFTVAPGGLVDGTTTTVGGSFTVEATGDIEVQKPSTTAGKILVSGSTQGGSILLDAGGDITIAGQLLANNRNEQALASGGDINLRAGGDIVTSASSDIDPHGGIYAFGGTLDLVAGGMIDIGNSIDNSGGDGGYVSIIAGGKVIIRDQLNVTGDGDAGSGGDIDIVAGTYVEIKAKLQSLGTTSSTGSGGGDGGGVSIVASFGDITVEDEISVRSGLPDGGGGDIELFAQGSIDVQPAGEIIANGYGPESWGGDILLGARIDVTINGSIEAEAGDCGGDIGIEAGRDIALNAQINAKGTGTGSFGGSVSIEAGLVTSGNLTLANVIDVSGSICDAYGSCSLGGDADASACDLTVQSSGSILADALGPGGNGGAIFLTARDQLTILGPLDATGGGGSLDGSNNLIHPAGISPVLTGSVSPPPTITPRALCIGGRGNPPFCLIPCPVCGNGVMEFPETCDTTGTPVSCDGCSRFCQLENCNDANSCTADSCDPDLGCLNALRPNGTPCGDGTICNGEEFCLGGTCLAGQPLDCRDTNTCTLDSCDPVTGCHNDQLTGEPCSDGSACTGQDTCNAGICVPGGQIVCDDGNECTKDSCNPASGCVFSHLSLVPCIDDGDPCTDDICFSGLCTHPELDDGSSCDDADPCTQTATCLGGICTGSNPVICTALDQCHDAGECVPALGSCTNPMKEDGTGCEDGNPCTQTATCLGGICTGSNPVICTALDQCHDAGLCDPGTGICSNPAKPNATPCSDGLYCTVDSCQAGTCTSTARDCSDGNNCTTDFCVESGDECVHEPVALCCGNGIIEEGEECDKGTENSDEPNATCRTDCRASRCGNGVLDDLFGETCDLGEANSDEPNASCRIDCLEQRCGDGVVDDLSGEQCDDGDTGPDDGCSPRCFVDPPPNASLIPGKGSTKTDCIIEWKMDDVALDKKGRPLHHQSCVDGDPACDHDGAVNGQCIFHVWLCSNNTDPSLPLCKTGSGPNGKGVVLVVQVKEPNLKRALKVPAHGETRKELLRAGAVAPVGNGGDVCGPRLSLRVQHKALGKKGVSDLRITATTSLNVKDMDVLRLTCWP